MKIDRDKCTACRMCILFCPLEAISLKDEKAFIDPTKCVNCGTCRRVSVCPTDAIVAEVLSWPKTLSRFLSDPTVTKERTGVPGRGTEECKTNDVTGRIKRGEIGICVEPGRPEIGTSMRDVQKIAMALAKVGVEFEEKNPLTYLMTGKKSGTLREDILEERVLSCIIECKFNANKLEEILAALREVEGQINTVFSVGLICRLEPNGGIPCLQTLARFGIATYPNAKINLGLGKPLVKD